MSQLTSVSSAVSMGTNGNTLVTSLVNIQTALQQLSNTMPAMFAGVTATSQSLTDFGDIVMNPADPMTCLHPDRMLMYKGPVMKKVHQHSTVPGQSGYHMVPDIPASMWCSACRTVVMDVQDTADFLRMRELKYLSDTGYSSLEPRDMFGKLLESGCVVVYPKARSGSVDMGVGRVVAVNHTNVPDIEKARRTRCDAADRLKLVPYDYTGKRANTHYSWNTKKDGSIKAITLTTTAATAVVVGHD